jgi:phosphonoacetaldehyde hydrolase
MPYKHLKAIVLDWAGTTVDFGCFAPTMVFVEGFRAAGVSISVEEARQPMGLYKRDHIAAVLRMPRVSAEWQAVHGRTPSETDIDAIFAEFVPRQLAVLADYSALIPGVAHTIAALRADGLKIGSSTGYTRAMMDIVVPIAARQGYQPDAVICPDDVPAGRPAPFMCYANALHLAAAPLWHCVKVGDTPADMAEGRQAGMWCVAVTQTGNELGLTEAEIAALTADELAARLEAVEQRLRAAGAHQLIPSIAELPAALAHIDNLLAAGSLPSDRC